MFHLGPNTITRAFELFVFLLVFVHFCNFYDCHKMEEKGEEEKRKPFLWGVATAAYQIEGAVADDGRGPSIWDTFSKIPGKISHNNNGDIADNSYHLIEKDIEMLKTLGVNSYRFSISWSRILPSGYGEVNQLGIDHYSHFIDRLLEEGIEPLVTIFHWDLPQGNEDSFGGLLSPDLEKYFVEYSDILFRSYGDRVKKWITLNEPWTICFNAYGTGVFAPGRCSDRTKCPAGDSSTESYLAGHNLLNAHAAAVELYRTKYLPTQKGWIGITVNHDWAEPLTSKRKDVEAAERRREFQLAWFVDPLYFGDYPESMKTLVGDRLPSFTETQKKRLLGSFDFLGLNHYSTKYYFHRDKPTTLGERVTIPKDLVIHGINISEVEASMKYGGWADDQLNYETKYDIHGQLIGAQAASSWLNVVPWGFYKLIMWVHHRYEETEYHQRPMIITENGCDAPGEGPMPMEQAVKDSFR
jgi:beta-glucosidase